MSSINTKNLIAHFTTYSCYGYDNSANVTFKNLKEAYDFYLKKFNSKHVFLLACENLDNKNSNLKIEIVHPKVVTICPFRGVMDVSKLTIQYTPEKNILELSSFRQFIEELSTFAVTHESLVAFIERVLLKEAKIKAKITIDASPFLGMSVVIKN